MKTKYFIVVFILFIGIAAYLLMDVESLPTNSSARTEKAPTSADVPLPSQVTQSNQEETDFSSVLTDQEKALLANGYVLTGEQREKLLKRKHQKDLAPTMEELKVMIETPVEFYGQVLDQFDQPVVGAMITCYWGIYGDRSVPVKLQSAAPSGMFEIMNLKAFSIHVYVDPPVGYDEQVRDSKKIQIAKAPDRLLKKWNLKNATPEQLKNVPAFIGGPETYKGDKTKPVIFRLKKL